MSVAEVESVTFCADDQVVQPWQAEPYRLWSLYDMLQFSARAFFRSAGALRSITTDCLIAGAVVVDGQAAISLAIDLDDQGIEKAKQWLKLAEDQFKRVGMNISAETAREILSDLDKSRRSLEWLHTQVRALESLAAKELKDRVFLYIPPERMQFIPTNDKPHAFGDAVVDKFPSTLYDANEAARCYAFGRPTACVFHLMRVMEIGLSVLADQFSVAHAHKNWEQVIKGIENAVAGLETAPTKPPNWRDDREFYSQCTSYFRVMKDAYRNFTAHPRGKFDETEAGDIFANVRGFMQKLAGRLAE